MKNDNTNNRRQDMTDSKLYLERNRENAESGGIISVMFSGVGGQGIILASTVLAGATMIEGYDVKVSEVHGMAQRGGSVVGSVRFGKKVYSPIIEKADVIMALEKLESARYLDMLKPDGFLFINDYEMVPVSVYIGDKRYPDDIVGQIAKVISGYKLIKATEMAVSLGEIRATNMVLMGSLSKFLPIKLESWKYAIRDLVPKRVLRLNIDAFEKGREIIK